MSDRVTLKLENGVADVRLARADKMNALDHGMFAELAQMGERLKTEKGVRAVVLSGEGRAFCAGLDMSNFSKMAEGGSGSGEGLITDNRTPGGANSAQQAAMVWREVPVPVIAAVHGVAFGAGFQLALGADLRFVTADARFSIMEINWGLVPDVAGIALLRDLVRGDVARDLTYSGRIISGEEAAALGIATRVCVDPLADAMSYAAEVAGKNPDAIRAAKRLLNLSVEGDQVSILKAESDEQTKLIGSPNQTEAVMARLGKRAPAFQD